MTGTVAQINASLADDGIFNLAIDVGLVEYLERLSKNTLNSAAVNAIQGNVTSTPFSPDDLVGAIVAGPEGKSFSLGIALSSFALNSLALYATTGMGPSAQATAAFLFGVFLIATDAHLVEPDGTILDFNPEGEFVFATSTQSGNSFDVQVRLQPLGASQSASIVTQVAAQLGNDRLTFGVGRANTVLVNGTAVDLSLNTPDLLSGGELTQVDAQTYKVVWNTGEVLTVTNSGSFLNVSASAGPNGTPGSIVGLATLSAATTAGNDLTLPDGTVLSGPITTGELAQFANAWRVPQQFSLFDYAAGQSTATFTDTSYPELPIVLADLPASIVSAAAAVVAVAGITDPGVAAAAEFDYIASGGDITFVQADAQLLSGRTTTPETVTPSSPPPVSIGILPDKGHVMGDGTDPIPVVFDVYLTAAATADTVVNYAVLGNSGDIGAAAFGTLPSGSVTIAAGQTMAQVTITVPPTALGTLPQGQLELGISSPAGVPIFTPSAKAIVTQPLAGPPPVPVLSSLTRLGTFAEVNGSAGSNDTYTLDLGDIQYGEPLPAILFGITNAGPATADSLGGTFTVASVDGFTVTGAALPSGLSGGQAYDGLNLAVDFTKFGPNEETITYTPTDTNNSGFASNLAPITLNIKDNIVAPSMVFSQAWGDVHIVTYNGLKYDFQEVGEFTLAQSRIAGDSFDIQLRLQPWFANNTVSVITQVAVSLGTDRVTFDVTRPDTIDVDGVASTLSATNPTVTLNGGTLSYVSSNVFQVNWTTGEEATITDMGKYLNVSDGIPLSLPNSVGGLQGEDAGQANDFQLPDGTVLPQPLTYDQLHQEFADGWRVSQAASLFDYPAGEGTANFTDRNFPADVVPLSSLPAGMVASAAALVAAAGITDPGIAQSAEQDYLATGDASFIASSAAVQQQVVSTTIVTPTNLPAPAALAGVTAPATSVKEAATGTTNVAFQVFLTATQATDTMVNYTVVDGGPGTLGAAAFGGTLPSGTVTVPAGQTTANLTIAVPPNALGANPDETLQVQLLPTGATQIYKSTATVTVANPTPEPGSPAVPILTDLSNPGALVATSATAYTLNLGALSQGQGPLAQQLAVENAGAASADLLAGSFGAPLGNGFTVVGNALRNAPLTGGESYSGLYVSANTDLLASNTGTLVFNPTDTNASGYSAALPAITLTIKDTVAAPAIAGLNTPSSILFPNAHVGAVQQRALSITNTAAAPASSLDVTAVAGGNATTTGAIKQLLPGSTDTGSLVAALDTTATGMRQGIVALQAASDGGTGGTMALPDAPTVDLFGTVYRLAAATTAPITETVHVGDPGNATLAVTNSAATDGYSENLAATLASVTGGVRHRDIRADGGHRTRPDQRPNARSDLLHCPGRHHHGRGHAEPHLRRNGHRWPGPDGVAQRHDPRLHHRGQPGAGPVRANWRRHPDADRQPGDAGARQHRGRVGARGDRPRRGERGIRPGGPAVRQPRRVRQPAIQQRRVRHRQQPRRRAGRAQPGRHPHDGAGRDIQRNHHAQPDGQQCQRLLRCAGGADADHHGHRGATAGHEPRRQLPHADRGRERAGHADRHCRTVRGRPCRGAADQHDHGPADRRRRHLGRRGDARDGGGGGDGRAAHGARVHAHARRVRHQFHAHLHRHRRRRRVERRRGRACHRPGHGRHAAHSAHSAHGGAGSARHRHPGDRGHQQHADTHRLRHRRLGRGDRPQCCRPVRRQRGRGLGHRRLQRGAGAKPAAGVEPDHGDRDHHRRVGRRPRAVGLRNPVAGERRQPAGRQLDRDRPPVRRRVSTPVRVRHRGGPTGGWRAERRAGHDRGDDRAALRGLARPGGRSGRHDVLRRTAQLGGG